MGKSFQLSVFILLLMSNVVVASGLRVDDFREGDEKTLKNPAYRFGVFQEDPMACHKKYSAFKVACPDIDVTLHTILEVTNPNPIAYFFITHKSGDIIEDLLSGDTLYPPSTHIITEAGIMDVTQKKSCFKFMAEWLKKAYSDSHASFLGSFVGEILIVKIQNRPLEFHTGEKFLAQEIGKVSGMRYVSSQKGTTFFEIGETEKATDHNNRSPLSLKKKLILFKQFCSGTLKSKL